MEPKIYSLKHEVVLPKDFPHSHSVPDGYSFEFCYTNFCGNIFQEIFIYNNDLMVLFETNPSTKESRCKSNLKISVTDTIEIG